MRNTDPAELARLSARNRAAWQSRDETPAVTAPTVAPESRPKYGNRKTVRVLDDGTVLTFDSRKEAARWDELFMLERVGDITDLQRQVPFELVPAQPPHERRAVFTADFTYRENGELVVEDVKSAATKTQAYVLRRKLMLYRHGIVVRET